MKASEMTNEELASFFDELASFNREDDKFRETAARLRKTCAKNFKCDSLGEQLAVEQRKVDALRSKLKAAEDALVKLKTICEQTEYSYGRSFCDEALAAIREEGGAK